MSEIFVLCVNIAILVLFTKQGYGNKCYVCVVRDKESLASCTNEPQECPAEKEFCKMNFKMSIEEGLGHKYPYEFSCATDLECLSSRNKTDHDRCVETLKNNEIGCPVCFDESQNDVMIYFVKSKKKKKKTTPIPSYTELDGDDYDEDDDVITTIKTSTLKIETTTTKIEDEEIEDEESEQEIAPRVGPQDQPTSTLETTKEDIPTPKITNPPDNDDIPPEEFLGPLTALNRPYPDKRNDTRSDRERKKSIRNRGNDDPESYDYDSSEVPTISFVLTITCTCAIPIIVFG